MRILLLNPNTTQEVTDLMREVAAHAAAAGTQIVARTAWRGVPYIATRAEAQIAGALVLEMLAEAGDIDAAIIAAFGDPGLHGARELFDFPVVGMAQAAMLTACMLGTRFSIVTFARALEPWFEEIVETHGLSGRCASVRTLEGTFRSITNVQEEKEELIVELANRAAREDKANVVILGGAPLSGLAAKIKDRVEVPLVDQVAAAVKQAEALVTLSPRKAIAGSFRRPDPKHTTGLTDALAARIEHRPRK